MFYPSTCVGLRYGCRTDMLSGFSRQSDYRLYRPPPRGKAYYRASAQGAYFTTPFGTFALQRTIPSVRGRSTTASPRRSARQYGNVDPLCHRLRPSAEAYDPTDPGMTGIARETLDLRRGGISPPLSLLIPTFAFP